MFLNATIYALHTAHHRELLKIAAMARAASQKSRHGSIQVRLGDFLIRSGLKLKGQPAADGRIVPSVS